MARNVKFIAELMESGVDFRACDIPEANRLLLHIMAAVAENEARAISDRTVAALQAAKARGVALGATNPNSRNLTDEHRRKGAQRVSEIAAAEYAAILPTLKKMRAKGLGYHLIAKSLNDDGQQTPKGSPWTAMQVRRVLLRAA